MITYFRHILIALDQLLTTIIGGFPDETLSSLAYRMRLKKKPTGFFANWIDWVALNIFTQKDHCYKSYLQERARLEMPPELRD